MSEVRVNISAINAVKSAIESYYRDMADVISNFTSNCSSCGKWCDEHHEMFLKSAERLLNGYSTMRNTNDALTEKLSKKAELIAENKTYRV